RRAAFYVAAAARQPFLDRSAECDHRHGARFGFFRDRGVRPGTRARQGRDDLRPVLRFRFRRGRSRRRRVGSRRRCLRNLYRRSDLRSLASSRVASRFLAGPATRRTRHRTFYRRLNLNHAILIPMSALVLPLSDWPANRDSIITPDGPAIQATITWEVRVSMLIIF